MQEQLTDVVTQAASEIAKEAVLNLLVAFETEMLAQGIEQDWAEAIIAGAMQNWEELQSERTNKEQAKPKRKTVKASSKKKAKIKASSKKQPSAVTAARHKSSAAR